MLLGRDSDVAASGSVNVIFEKVQLYIYIYIVDFLAGDQGVLMV